ncbi:MAG: efflux RND transporter permease subunit [Pseudomonadota bacterium]
MNPAVFAIQNRLISFIVIIISLFAGWSAYQTMPRFEDPEFVIRQAVVMTEYPGATPLEVAEEVTERLESAIQQLQEVEEITSESSFGRSRITVEIKYDFSKSKADLQLIWTKLRNKVADASRQLPPGAGEPFVNDDFGDVYGVYYFLTGEGFEPRELYQYARDLRTDLLSVDGVAKVAITGEKNEQIFVEISRERAAALGVSVESVFQDLSQQNAVVSAGTILADDRRLVIRPTGNINSVEAIKDLVVSSPGAGPTSSGVVRLGDIANVERGLEEPPAFILKFNGQDAIALGVSNVSGANVVAMGAAIDAKLAETESLRPWGIEVHEFYHQGNVVDQSVNDFALNVLAALVIVLVTLLLFMGLKSAVIIGFVLLLTIAATVATMQMTGIPMHRISLGALIIALGMLVDNAIVVTEGILVGVKQGRKKLEVAREIVSRTIWPLLGGTAVGILAFAPIGFAPGSTAEYTQHLFWVVLISLLFSWVFAITIVPLLADLLFKESAAEEEKPDGVIMRTFKGFLALAVRARIVVVLAAVGLFAGSIWGFGFVKSGFFPASTTPQIVLDFWLPEGTAIERTEERMEELAEFAAEQEGVLDVASFTGQGGLRYMLIYPPESPNSSYGQLLLRVDDYKSVDALLPRLQAHADENFPDGQTKVWRFTLGPGGGSAIEAQFSGPDPQELRRVANEARAILAADAATYADKTDWRQETLTIEPIYSESRARRIGVSRESLSNALRTTYSGRPVGFYREDDLLIPIISRAPERERLNVQGIGDIPIPSAATGGTVPLSEAVEGFDAEFGDAIIRRLDRVWTIQAQADAVAGVLPSEVFARVRPQIEAIELPEGVTLSWQGEYGDSLEANQNLASVLPFGVLAMVLTVVLLFNAVRQPLVIWLVVPLALVGVVTGLVVTDTALEFMAILGILSLSGLLIKNAIVLVDEMDLRIGDGTPRFTAVVAAAASRARPVILGALTTVLGVIPLFGDAFFRAMAVVLVFGLSFATLLTLVVVPVLYAMIFNIKSSEQA